MNCRHTQQLLFADPEVSQRNGKNRQLEEHLRDCEPCRRLHAASIRVERRLQEMADSEIEPRQDLERLVVERCLSERRTRPVGAARELPTADRGPKLSSIAFSRLVSPHWLRSAAAVAVLSALGLLGWTDNRTSRSNLDPGHQPAHRQQIATAPPPAASWRGNNAEAQRDRRAAVTSPLPATTDHEPGSPADAATKSSTGRGEGPTPHLADAPASSEDHWVDPNDGKEAARGSLPRFTAGEWEDLEAQVRRRVPVRDDFVTIPFPRLAAASDRPMVAATEAYKREAAIVDARLAREVTLQFKATALSDLCDRLRTDTGIRLEAGRSVADEKVTVFCRKLPLRDVMRQLSRPFGYTWLRTRKDEEYRYELVQDLKSQLLDEELRNRDRHAALLSLDRELERFRPYLDLTPEEALARLKTAPAAEKPLLETMTGYAWGAIQMYFRLSSRDLTAMRSGQELVFRTRPQPGEQPLPPDLQPGVLQSFRDWTVVKYGDGYRMAFEVANPTSAPVPVPALSGAHASVSMRIQQRDLGRMTLTGWAGWGSLNSQGQDGGAGGSSSASCATGISPTVLKPDNAQVNAKLAQEPALRPRFSVRPRPSCALPPDPNAAEPGPAGPRVTTADVLEALHQASGLPIVADYYTRLYKPEEVSARDRMLFEALNTLADRMRMRWRWESGWLQFRSTSYYDDRVKEVPNRLLAGWAAVRRQQGALGLDDLVEIAQLSDAQLDAREMAEGAKAAFGLIEWDLGCNTQLRSHLRFLAAFTPSQRQEAMRPAGLLFTRMPLAQQQRFIALALGSGGEGLQSFEELTGSALRVEYTRPGGFQWGEAGHPGQGHYTRWVIPLEPGPQGRRVLRPIVQERTREAALQAVHRVDPDLRQALLEEVRRADLQLEPSLTVVEEGQIYPTRLDLCFVYMPGATNARSIQLQTSFASYGIRPH